MTTPTDAAPSPLHLVATRQIGTRGEDGTTAVDAAAGIVAHAGYVNGTLSDQSSGGARDAFVEVLNPDLVPIWAQQFGGPLKEKATSVATNGTHVLVGGETLDPIDGDEDYGELDGWFVLFDDQGQMLHTHTIDTAGVDTVFDVAIAGDDLYVSGLEDRHGKVWKYTVAGDLTWTADVGEIPAQLLVIDDLVVVTQNTVLTGDDGADGSTKTIALDVATGTEVWATTTNYGGATGLATDGTLLFTTRWSVNFDTERHRAVLTARDLEGALVWSASVLDDGDYDYDARAVTWDGRTIVVTTNRGLVGFTATGNHAWGAPLPANMHPYGAAFGPDMGFYVGGSLYSQKDAVVARAISYQPDARVRGQHSDVLVGDNIYDLKQRFAVNVQGVKPRTLVLSAQNDGEYSQPLRISACADRDGYRVRYFDEDDDNVTREVTTGKFFTGYLWPGRSAELRVVVTPLRRTTGPTTCKATIASGYYDNERDAITLKIRRP